MMWNRTYSEGSKWDTYSLVVTSDGGYAIAGVSSSGGAVSADFLLIKTDAEGNMEWSRTYGGTSNDHAYSLVQTSDGGYALAGRTYSFDVGQGDFWLVKTDAEGNMEWNRTYGGKNIEIAHSLVEVSDGGYALAGKTTSFGAGSSDFWLVKTDAQGIPEFPSWVIFPLLFVASFAAIIYKQKLNKNCHSSSSY